MTKNQIIKKLGEERLEELNKEFFKMNMDAQKGGECDILLDFHGIHFQFVYSKTIRNSYLVPTQQILFRT